jgi:hypothetical protein
LVGLAKTGQKPRPSHGWVVLGNINRLKAMLLSPHTAAW